MRPDFSTSNVEALLIERYNINASIAELESYSDQLFIVSVDGKAAYVFKIMNSDVSEQELRFQTDVLTYLENKEAGFVLPTVAKSHDDQQIINVAKDDQTYRACLLTYLSGTFLGEINSTPPKLVAKFGDALARLDLALLEFSHPAQNRELVWDMARLPALGSYVGEIKSAERRRILDYFLLQFDVNVLPQLAGLRRSVIHNDANEWNILLCVTADDVPKFGLIDFGDMAYSILIADLAVCATYMMMRAANPLATLEILIAAYHAKLPLTETEVSLLYYLIAARLCISVIMSAREQKRNPDNDYIAISEKPASALLEKLIKISPSQMAQQLRLVCGFDSPILAESKTAHGQKELRQRREHAIGPSLSLSYADPLTIVRGAFQYLFDDRGRAYLDCVNNVCHVGHCHPRVVRAISHQASQLNTNTRYLHPDIVQFSEALLDKFDPELDTCYFVNSGSEANELALRLARTYTAAQDIIVLDHAYHGNTGELVNLSPYKFKRRGGFEPPEYAHVAPLPDPFRGIYAEFEDRAFEMYLDDLRNIVRRLAADNKPIAAFLAESLPGCGGQIVLPPGYLRKVYDIIRSVGGVCIADEVQVGFGRVGSHFWGFELQDVVPDIVTLGKPIGNGHPIGAVVTKRKIADAFNNGMEYFNTFGGNPVSSRVGTTVLNIIEDESLQSNADVVGTQLLKGLKALQTEFPVIGDVRGAGLFVGAELVSATHQPQTRMAGQIVNHMKNLGFLLSTDGPDDNVIKIKPPLVISAVDVDQLLENLYDVFSQLKTEKMNNAD